MQSVLGYMEQFAILYAISIQCELDCIHQAEYWIVWTRISKIWLAASQQSRLLAFVRTYSFETLPVPKGEIEAGRQGLFRIERR